MRRRRPLLNILWIFGEGKNGSDQWSKYINLLEITWESQPWTPVKLLRNHFWRFVPGWEIFESIQESSSGLPGGSPGIIPAVSTKLPGMRAISQGHFLQSLHRKLRSLMPPEIIAEYRLELWDLWSSTGVWCWGRRLFESFLPGRTPGGWNSSQWGNGWELWLWRCIGGYFFHFVLGWRSHGRQGRKTFCFFTAHSTTQSTSAVANVNSRYCSLSAAYPYCS